MIHVRLITTMIAALYGISDFAAEQHPFADAMVVWHMAELKDSIGNNPLTGNAPVGIGIELSGAEKAASLARGGDGRIATFDGGYFDAGQAMAKELESKGEQFTLCARLRDPTGNWNAPLFSKRGSHATLVYNLFSTDLGQGKVLGFELGTERTPGVTQLFVPLAMIGEKDWHDIICRYDGAKLQLFIDGVWMDEGFPMGPLRKGNHEPVLFGAESDAGAIRSGWHGMIDHVAIWTRPLSDAEITTLSGGAEVVAAKKAQYLGASPSMQYFRPPNQFNVGDTFPFFHDGIFHFYYLLDRGHHQAKGGRGAHQWAQASSRDLVHWTEQPLAVPITREAEGSICTGSVFFNEGTYYGFYATRGIDGAEKLSLATGTDGIHFTKTDPNPFLSPGPQYTKDFRDPFAFVDEKTGEFRLIVSTVLKDGHRGCLAQYTSKDLKHWEEIKPFLIEGNEVPECPDYFQWNGWYYLFYSNGGVARYRMSRQPYGHWERPKSDVIDGGSARVMKTAAFTGNRRIGTVFLAPQGYAGYAVFRELIQNSDGTLGSAFVPEMIPATNQPVKLNLSLSTASGGAVSGDGTSVHIASPSGTNEAVLTGLPLNGRIQLRIDGKAESIRLKLGASNETQAVPEIRFSPPNGTVSIAGGPSLANVQELDKPFTVDLVLKDQLIDLCVGGRRTLIAWAPQKRGDQLTLIVDNGTVTFDQIRASPLKGAANPAMAETSGEKYRPQFHFTAPKGWLNDPNGLVYENGEWHLFYQHNPNGTNWVSELFWGHAVSKDLLHWNHLPEAIPPMPTLAGKVAGSWSGTGFIDFNNSAGFKTGDKPPIMLVWTAVGVGQCLAYSNDHGRTFIRYEKNPVVAMDPPKSDDWDRDPRVFWHEPTQKWVMVFSISGKGMIFYTSRDLKTWEKQTLFAGLFECPDIFELPVDGKAGDKKWIIWDAAGKYFIGQFDGREFHPESGPFIVDHGSSYYAAQTWSNTPAGRHVGIGWMREGKFPGMPFNQQMSIPFELSLRNTPDGARLTKTPIKEVESLRYDTKEWKDLDLDRNHNPLAQIDGKADTLDIEAEIETRNASEVVLKVRGNTLRLTPDLLWLNNSAAPLRPNAGKIKLRILVDRTSVEVFANDGLVSLSASYLPSDDEKKRDKPPELYAEHGIAKINWMRVHRLKSAWSNDSVR